MLTSENREKELLEQFESLSTNNKPFSGSYPPLKKGDKGFPAPKQDFRWDETSDEPHRTRRKIILQKYPQIQELYGHCPKTKYSVLFLVSAQFALAYYLKDKMWTAQYWILAYVFGATITHSLFLAIHEISHFLAFKKPLHNRLLGFFANLPIGIPYCTAFRGYHMEHHTLQGVDGVDTDLPTKIEGILFQSTLGKLFFCIFQILFYVLSGSLHPMAGHFIAEHYVFVEGYETYSYYGPLNLLAYNVGYHNEHHDFPRIPGSRLPLVRKIAPEFYNDLPQVKSWPMTIVNFILFPHISPYSRVKRHAKSN
ncbi:Sphingolipid delta(4)-desaturase DES1 [Boothiomyces macroporosus]|uniref:Sphingolipid delta(4)-desaturase DES1 n=1 Tax=Boothiomyces macroporosus TaxID=261099 RepID=A0AAD5UI91_9FUNG|nr:Sphingolipid delta(4)-desaturase DES1 [Boothiomyces macroporosus]